MTLRRCGLRVQERQDGPALVWRCYPHAPRRCHPHAPPFSRNFGFCTHPRVIVGQTSARFTSPLPPWRLVEDSWRCCPHAPFLSLLMRRCYPQAIHVFEQMRQSVIDSLLKLHSTENSIQSSSVLIGRTKHDISHLRSLQTS